MKISNRITMVAAAIILVLIAWLCAGDPSNKLVFAQASSKPASKEGKEVSLDEYQRSSQVFYMQRFGKNGWQRGEEIYLTKCWICHNDYTIKADPKGAAPTLRDLYKRSKLMSGQPINDQTVAIQIREGSSRMPSYRAVFNDKDLTDIVTYLREHCCWDENNPPPNPRYRY